MTKQKAIKRYDLHRDFTSGDWRVETWSSDTKQNGIRTAVCLAADELALLLDGEIRFYLVVEKFDYNKLNKYGFPKRIYGRLFEIED